MVSVGWVGAFASTGTLVISGLTYRMVRRSGSGGGWSAEIDRTDPLVKLVLTRITGPSVKNVRIILAPAESEIFVGYGARNEPAACPHLDHGGHLDYFIATEYPRSYPNAVTVKWTGRFGRDRTWRSGL